MPKHYYGIQEKTTPKIYFDAQYLTEYHASALSQEAYSARGIKSNSPIHYRHLGKHRYTVSDVAFNGYFKYPESKKKRQKHKLQYTTFNETKNITVISATAPNLMGTSKQDIKDYGPKNNHGLANFKAAHKYLMINLLNICFKENKFKLVMPAIDLNLLSPADKVKYRDAAVEGWNLAIQDYNYIDLGLSFEVFVIDPDHNINDFKYFELSRVTTEIISYCEKNNCVMVNLAHDWSFGGEYNGKKNNLNYVNDKKVCLNNGDEIDYIPLEEQMTLASNFDLVNQQTISYNSAEIKFHSFNKKPEETSKKSNASESDAKDYHTDSSKDKNNNITLHIEVDPQHSWKDIKENDHLDNMSWKNSLKLQHQNSFIYSALNLASKYPIITGAIVGAFIGCLTGIMVGLCTAGIGLTTTFAAGTALGGILGASLGSALSGNNSINASDNKLSGNLIPYHIMK